MLFTEPIFFLFFASVFAFAWHERRPWRRKLGLLVASYLFYAAWDWRFLSLILISTAADFVAGRALASDRWQGWRRVVLGVSLTTNLGILAFFKYYNFFVESAASLFAALGRSPADRALEIVLPVGISFYTFQTMSYTIDVYRRRLPAVESFLDFALFVGFFPQLVAGPIVRARDFLPQLERLPHLDPVDVRRFLILFLFGFIKKACIADTLAPHVDEVFASPATYTATSLWIAVLFYSVQIYCDFSGYSDMAIACAGLLGYDLGQNFAFPYLAANVTELWRRWHISLSTWLRDYLYIPLGGSRGSTLATCRNLLVTMILGGLWHGAAWTFVVWGAVHGLALVIHRFWRRLAPASRHRFPGYRAVGISVTFSFVSIAWIFFRAQSLSQAIMILEMGSGLEPAGRWTLDPVGLLWLAALILAHCLSRRWPPQRLAEALPRGVFAGAYGVATALALAFVPLRSEPFIYFQF